MSERFVLIENNTEFPADDKTCWYWDTERPGNPEDGDKWPFMAVQCYSDRNPNDFVRCENMGLLFTDQAEYYVVCQSCRSIYGDMQWSGNTSARNWRQESRQALEYHQEKRGWCQFCDPIFGNGGWIK